MGDTHFAQPHVNLGPLSPVQAGRHGAQRCWCGNQRASGEGFFFRTQFALL